ncbi:hypothetical protein GWK47_026782 [Chionoecetes opilio]|uniref:GATA zinc finger domain-containing protein 1 n=1 Tax=Chionoecetes opilio TaxID=41210 RepID=A0A8J8WCS8_CHIOP|nr:hypothetical protein GWK47_026782 [Chionoecetes opilio]
MVFGFKPVCDKCGTKETNLWHKDDNDQVVCSECQVSAVGPQPRVPARASRSRDEDDQDTARDEEKVDHDDHKDADSSNGNGGKDDDQDKDSGRSSDKRETKRRTRKGRQGGKGSVPKGKGRRYIFKKSGEYPYRIVRKCAVSGKGFGKI